MIKHKAFLTASLVLSFVVFSLLNAPSVHADSLGAVTNYTIPTSSSYPYAIAEGSDGNMWFTENSGNKIGKITTSGAITEYSLPYSNSGPVNIVNGPNNSLWFTEENAHQVGEITTTGSITQYNLPIGSQPDGIVAGPDGDLWVTSYSSNRIFRMTNTGSYTTYYLNNASAYGVYVASDPVHDEVWVGQRNGGTGGWISKFSMDGTETDYALPSSMQNIYTMVQGNDGDIYFTAGGTAGHFYVDKVDDSGTFSVASDLGSGHSVWTVRVGLDGYVWATDYTAGKMARVDSSLNVTEYSSGLSNPLGLASGSDGNMWFTQYTSNTISKIGEGSYTDVDADGDGLTASQELQLGTSDLVVDTSHDGLSDYIKSPWNTNRQAEFCNSSRTNCAYPDPLKRNLYVDIDWMVAPDGTSYQPSSLQLNAVQSAYAAHGINFQFDTGNFSDGKQVPYNQIVYFKSSEGTPNFLDYKYGGNGIPAEFDSTNRAEIWRYALFGNQFSQGGQTNSSGVSTAGGLMDNIPRSILR